MVGHFTLRLIIVVETLTHVQILRFFILLLNWFVRLPIEGLLDLHKKVAIELDLLLTLHLCVTFLYGSICWDSSQHLLVRHAWFECLLKLIWLFMAAQLVCADHERLRRFLCLLLGP